MKRSPSRNSVALRLFLQCNLVARAKIAQRDATNTAIRTRFPSRNTASHHAIDINMTTRLEFHVNLGLSVAGRVSAHLLPSRLPHCAIAAVTTAAAAAAVAMRLVAAPFDDI